MAQKGPPVITRPVVFSPFNPDAAACSRPPGLRKALIFAQDNERKFMQGVARGLELALNATASVGGMVTNPNGLS